MTITMLMLFLGALMMVAGVRNYSLFGLLRGQETPNG